MEKEKLRIILDLIVVILLFLTVAVLIIFLITVLQDGGQCVLNPASYYAKLNNISNICEHCGYNFGMITP
jgi:hypothetical protein